MPRGSGQEPFAQVCRTRLEVFDCRYGSMLAFSADNVISRSLRLYGEWAEHELHVLRPFVAAGTVVVDIGANIGTHVLPFSHWVGAGRVIAIEAQPTVCQVLSANCRRNGRYNVDVINAICAETSGRRVCYLNYNDEQNVGGISFSEVKARGWRKLLRWLPGFNDPRVVDVPVIALDDLSLTETVSLVKIDIEGMELDALRGAHATIARFRPAIFFEQNDAKRLSDTYDYLAAAGYRMFWLETHPFNRNNYRGDTENIWWRTETGVIAIPPRAVPPGGLVEARRDDASPPSELDARAGIAIEQKISRRLEDEVYGDHTPAESRNS